MSTLRKIEKQHLPTANVANSANPVKREENFRNSSGFSRGRDFKSKNDGGLLGSISLAALAPAGSKNAKSGPDPDTLAERIAIAVDNVPARYADAWGHLQLQRPFEVDGIIWRQAIDDAGRFLDAWGALADEIGWSAGDLFDVPRDGAGGLVWFLAGEDLRAFGPEHAITTAGRVFDRLDRSAWASISDWRAAQGRPSA